MVKILITDPLLRKTFDVVNILLSKVDIKSLVFLCFDNNTLKKTKNIYKSYNLHHVREECFSEDLYTLSKEYEDYKIIYIPIEESTTINFYDFIKKYGNQNFLFMLPHINSFNLSRNKDELNRFCELNKIPCPKYYSEKQIKERNFELPIILKPINGSGSIGIKYLKKLNDLTSLEIDYNNYFIQELLNNPKNVEAGFFLCSDGKIISFYSHERIRTYPNQGGVSVFSKSTFNKKILNAGSKIIKELNWSGFIMIEFIKCNKSKEYKLIEINPRLWGSFLLSEFSGANFVSNYMSLCSGDKLEKNNLVREKYIRWIFPYDLIYFLKKPKNPFKFFKIKDDTCYVNFSYCNLMKSFRFILFSYFNYKKIKQKIFNG